mmetsp:Transcript_73857/g.173281  ORF Transcript_73857/g.173281 Transcript_73857/m.173281 type:complete len:182 (+) Transcript_73857:64-609(+)|eukprot:s23_g5.t1
MAPNCRVPCKPDEVCMDCLDLPSVVMHDRKPVPEAFASKSPTVRSSGISGSSCGSSLYSADTEQSLKKRQMRKQKSDAAVAHFLKEHNFGPDVSEPRTACCVFLKEAIYPIHVAAKLGDAEMVRLLLKAGAKRDQRSSKGRSPADIAFEEDNYGSHQDVLELLRGPLKFMPLRDFVSLARP